MLLRSVTYCSPKPQNPVRNLLLINMNTVRIICFLGMAVAQDQKLVTEPEACEDGTFFVEEFGTCEPCPVGEVCTSGEKKQMPHPLMSQIRKEMQLIASYAKKNGSHLRARSAISVKLARSQPFKRMLVLNALLESTLTRVIQMCFTCPDGFICPYATIQKCPPG